MKQLKIFALMLAMLLALSVLAACAPKTTGTATDDGISIVATIASTWGSRRTLGGGKAVWCEFALPGEHGH